MTTLAVAAQIETAETLNPEGPNPEGRKGPEERSTYGPNPEGRKNPRRTDAGKAEH